MQLWMTPKLGSRCRRYKRFHLCGPTLALGPVSAILKIAVIGFANKGLMKEAR